MERKIGLLIAVGIIMSIIAIPNFAYASYQAYQSPQITKVGTTSITVAATKATISVTSPTISQSAPTDHRDYMVYILHSLKFTLGAGWHVEKNSQGNYVKNELVYYWNEGSQTLSHYLHNPWAGYTSVVGQASQNSPGSGCWTGKVFDGSGTTLIFSIGVCPNNNAVNPTPSATGLALKPYTASPLNNMPGTFDQINVGWYDSGGGANWHLIDSGVTISDYKCGNDGSYYYYSVNNFYKFNTGPGTATSSNCSAPTTAREAPGE